MKDIQGFEGLYAITEDGKIWSYPRIKKTKNKNGTYRFAKWGGYFLKKSLSVDGYIRVCLYKNKFHRLYFVHRFVAEAFIPNPDNLPEVNHKNGTKSDNRLENLEWVTRAQNAQHSVDIGLQTYEHCTGENHYSKRLPIGRSLLSGRFIKRQEPIS